MRGKTSSYRHSSASVIACFNEAPLLCGERRSEDRVTGRVSVRFNEAPLLCGERQGYPGRAQPEEG